MAGYTEMQKGLSHFARVMELRQEAACSSGVNHVVIPEDMAEAYGEFVWWKHITTKQPVRGLNYLQAHYLKECSCWKHERLEDGTLQRIGGSDAVMKSRKMRATSLMLGCAAIEKCRIPDTRVIVVLQHKKVEIMYPIWLAYGWMLSQLPPGWCEIDRKPSSEAYAYYFANGSSLELQTAGSSEAVADSLVRSGTPSIVLLSEAGMYAHFDLVISAVVGALPEEHSYLVAETTPPRSQDHPFAREFEYALDGRGQFQWAGFYPWYRDPQRIIRPNHPKYDMVMSPSFERSMDEKELAKEIALKLTEKQKAWRRYRYLRGTTEAREQARREYPEDLATCYGIDGSKPYVHTNALDKLRSMIREPVIEEQLAHLWHGSIWDLTARKVLVTTDMATMRGEDKTVLLAVNPWTMDVVGMVHGHATPIMMMAGLRWLLEKLQCSKRCDHWVAPETNYDDRIGFVAERLMTSGEFNLWYKEYTNKHGEVKEVRMPGYRIGNHNRAKFMTGLLSWLEGDPLDMDACGPLSKIPSRIAWEEACSLRKDTKTGRVEAPPGKKGAHDDILMALGGALYVKPFLHLPAKQSATRGATAAKPMVQRNRRKRRALR